MGRPRRAVRRFLERGWNVEILPVGTVALVFEWQHLRRFFRQFAVDCVFDIGANSGQYAAMLRERVGYRGPIVSYEPVPEVAARLRAAAAADKHWTVEELALDATAGEARLNVFNMDQFSSLHELSDVARRYQGHVQLARQVPVRTTTLAAELGRYRSLIGFSRPYLKLDTQGHDLRVAEGAGAQLRDFVGLQSELAVQRLYEDAPDFEEALRFYRDRGFELSALVPNNLGHFPRLLEVDCIMFRRGEA